MKTYKTLNTALRAHAAIASRIDRLNRKLNRIARQDACKGDITTGWDWPTLRICRPADYGALLAMYEQLNTAATWVRWFSFVPVPAVEFSNSESAQ